MPVGETRMTPYNPPRNDNRDRDRDMGVDPSLLLLGGGALLGGPAAGGSSGVSPEVLANQAFIDAQARKQQREAAFTQVATMEREHGSNMEKLKAKAAKAIATHLNDI